MVKLNEINLLWSFGNFEKVNLEEQVYKSLEAWNRRKDCKDYVPEQVVFNISLRDKITDIYILGMEVKFEKTVQKSTFMLRGFIY